MRVKLKTGLSLVQSRPLIWETPALGTILQTGDSLIFKAVTSLSKFLSYEKLMGTPPMGGWSNA